MRDISDKFNQIVICRLGKIYPLSTADQEALDAQLQKHVYENYRETGQTTTVGMDQLTLNIRDK